MDVAEGRGEGGGGRYIVLSIICRTSHFLLAMRGRGSENTVKNVLCTVQCELGGYRVRWCLFVSLLNV